MDAPAVSSETPARLLSVVVPFYNRAAGVRPCLQVVLAQQLPPGWQAEYIAVDNASTDGTREEISRFPVRLVDCARRSPGAARNAGVQAATGEIVVFTDSDCIPQDGWLAELVSPFEDPEVLITGGKIRGQASDADLARFTEEHSLLDNAKFFDGTLCFPPFFATANAAFRRSALLQVGGFDDTIWMGEDSDLCWRVMDLGGKLVYCPEAVVEHAHRTDLPGFYRQAQDYGASAVHVFAKHRERLGLHAYIHWDHARKLARLPGAILQRQLTRSDSYEKKELLYELVWRTGYAVGCLRGCLRWKVVFF